MPSSADPASTRTSSSAIDAFPEVPSATTSSAFGRMATIAMCRPLETNGETTRFAPARSSR